MCTSLANTNGLNLIVDVDYEKYPTEDERLLLMEVETSFFRQVLAIVKSEVSS